ncbi:MULTISPECIES: class I lanthipeptide [Flavobacterium]|uniref:Class I lanthipeptide n=1 Tax=Flavobacterium endoglycinae TaxID=2816357 RepID=A0ABX7QKL5_9FLAO|nr:MULTISPECIES: class I lanthipeptide [Flavobacterium]QSW91096.1 class I lanthipeptide [Flavobacterium endoglycinae]
MKKQNLNNKLAFNKVAVTELNDKQMQDVDGGTTLLCTIIFITVVVVVE